MRRHAEVLCVGAASVDATWNTGAGQGQLGGAGNHLSEDYVDPYVHTTKMAPTDGVQSRTYATSVVLQGPDGTRAAYVKTEVYLEQESRLPPSPFAPAPRSGCVVARGPQPPARHHRARNAVGVSISTRIETDPC